MIVEELSETCYQRVHLRSTTQDRWSVTLVPNTEVISYPRSYLRLMFRDHTINSSNSRNTINTKITLTRKKKCSQTKSTNNCPNGNTSYVQRIRKPIEVASHYRHVYYVYSFMYMEDVDYRYALFKIFLAFI